ncbi:MAG: hypothetical protein AAGE76_05805 [Pseudomonadota bacterium]
MSIRIPQTPGGALAILTACFLGSAGLRLMDAAPAAAQQLAANPAEAVGGGCGEPADVVLKAVRERGEELDRREAELAERLALLQLAEAEFEEKQAALVAAEERLSATIARADGAAERDLAQLTAIYENVKPKRAVGIFESMEPTFAAGILARMNATSAAEILTLMEAEKAYAVSVILAARNMNAGGPAPAN